MNVTPGTPAAHAAGGFTLLELIVVLGIFAVLSVMAYGGLNSVLNVRSKVQQAMDRTTAMQKAYLRLRDDLQEACDRDVRDESGERAPAFETTQAGAVEFTRSGWRNPLLHARPTLERVGYRLDDRKQLVRASWPMLDRAPDTHPNELPILEDVEEVRWRFMDEQMEWQPQWPPAATVSTAQAVTPHPPRAVEVTIVTRDWGELRFLFTADLRRSAQQGVGPPGPGGQQGAGAGTQSP